MGYEVYFRDDIAQGIVSIAVAMLSTAVAHGGTNLEYCRGVLDTAKAQALNYGIPWRSLMSDLRSTLIEDERTDVLELVARSLSH
jgi:hypothetical protein